VRAAMAEISMKRAHDLDKQEIRGRIEKLAQKISDRIGGTWEWHGDETISEAHGVKAWVGYDKNSIFVEVSLPTTMRPFRRKLEAKIDEYLVGFLEKD
jgi:putative polyhydroxyalkanoate system protein